MDDVRTVKRDAILAQARGASLEEMAGILRRLDGFPAALKLLVEISGMPLNEAHLALRCSAAWSEYFGDTAAETAAIRAAFEKAMKQ